MTAPQRLGDLVEQYVATTLLARAELVALVSQEVYPDVAPASATLPAVVYQILDGNDQIAVGNAKIGATFELRVKAVSESTSKTQAVAIAREITAALHGAKGPVGATGVNVTNIQQFREFHEPYFDEPSDTWFQQEGGDFTVWIDNG